MNIRKAKRGGFFLVLVLIVIVIATMAVQSFTGLMVAFDKSAYLSGDLVQTRVAAESGSEVIRLVLADPPETRVESGGVFNNPNLFQAIPVSMGIDGNTPCNFSVVAPNLNEYGQLAGLRFGLQNESARLNVNALPSIEANSDTLTAILALTGEASEEPLESENLAFMMLLSLPGMTEDTAAAILDWLDEDDEPREPNGAEVDYYAGLATPYTPTNGPVLSVEELLLVRGVTPSLLFGADSNRNGMLDPDEQQRFSVSVDTPGALGWAQYLTIHGGEASKTFAGGNTLRRTRRGTGRRNDGQLHRCLPHRWSINLCPANSKQQCRKCSVGRRLVGRSDGPIGLEWRRRNTAQPDPRFDRIHRHCRAR
jgi:hypothetical protein